MKYVILLKLMSDKSEIVPYDLREFPVYAKLERLSNYPNMTCVSHWHDELEFIVPLQGDMLYSVNGRDYALERGKGIFVNSRQMHASRPVDGADCEYLCVVFHPSLACATERLRQRYLEPLCADAACPALLLRPSIGWQGELLQLLRRLGDLWAEKGDGFELEALSILYAVCFLLSRHSKDQEDSPNAPPDKRLEALHRMLGFVQSRYADKIALEDIAAAGGVSKSGCCCIFRRVIHKTPVSYLTDYRVKKSLDLLGGTNHSVTEIALGCGFLSPSYFAEVFRERMGLTPTQYRERFAHAQSSPDAGM